MAKPIIPNYHVRQLTRALKQLRQESGLRQQEIADLVHFTLQKISRIETSQTPTYHELKALLAAYAVPTDEWKPYLDLWEQATKPAWSRKYPKRRSS